MTLDRQHRPSVSSSRSSYISDNNDPWDDDQLIAIPSSIASFHHPHPELMQSVSSTSNHLSPYGSLSINDVDDISSRTHHQNQQHHSNFHFFTNEQIENAEGFTSTVENTDYYTDSNNIFDNELGYTHGGSSAITQSNASLRSSLLSSGSGIRHHTYGATANTSNAALVRNSSSSSSASVNYESQERIPSLHDHFAGNNNIIGRTNSNNSIDDTGSGSGVDSNNEDEDDNKNHKYHLFDASNKLLAPKYHDKFFAAKPNCQVQRFYIAEEDLVVGIAGYKISKLRLILYYLLCLSTLGIGYLVFRWFPRYKIKLIGSNQPLGKAEFVVVENELGEVTTVAVERKWYNRSLNSVLISPENGIYDNIDLPILISFQYRLFTLIYSPVEDIFRTNSNWIDRSWQNLEKCKNGLTNNVHGDRILSFGKNECNLKIKSILELTVNEALHPFYIFQIFSIILWSYDDYYSYAICILILSVLSIATTVIETRKSSGKLVEMSNLNCLVRCYRDGFWITTSSSDLVPGDIFEVTDPELDAFPCDCVLLSGEVLTNESMLTGESVPVSKTPIPSENLMAQLLIDFESSKLSPQVCKSVLFNGTKLVRAKPDPETHISIAMCVRTGFSTTKGSLIRSMVFPSVSSAAQSNDMQKDSFKYIGYMFIIAMLGFTISAINFKRLGLSKNVIIVRALDIITIVIPPALPATLTIGTNFSLGRLKEKLIFCISPTRINIAGKLDVMCFDKTGTLTEDGLDVSGVKELNVKNGRFNPQTNVFEQIENPVFKMILQTCHSLNYLENEGLVGDPLDLKMFEFTNSKYHEDNANNDCCFVVDGDKKVLKVFDFESTLKRMSCLVSDVGGRMWGFSKGAPEVISTICKPGSIPHNYEQTLREHTHNGDRVIACAAKKISSNTVSAGINRSKVECDLEFLGFVIFENKLKAKTTETLSVLKDANIRTIMCTGDNILTAVSVAKECGLLPSDHRCYISIYNEEANEKVLWQDVDDPESFLNEITLTPALGTTPKNYSLAVTGDVFRLMFQKNAEIEEMGATAAANDSAQFLFSENYIQTVLLKSCIYARMSPDEKHELVEQLQKLDYCVGFCGDGANDCGALKAANVGISLSEAEASVAAPFTSQNFEISCVLDLIREGRASLVTSFACFQYMSLYSAIQFITITILYGRGSNLGDFQFLFIDLFLIVPLAVTMSWSKPYLGPIVKKRPSANLVSRKIIFPLVSNMIIVLVFQLIPWALIQDMKWYIKPVVGDQDTVNSSDDTVLFYVSNFQYIMIAVVLSLGPPYREPMMKNAWFIINVIVALLVCIWFMCLDPNSWWGSLMQLTKVPVNFKWAIIFWALFNYLMHIVIPRKLRTLFKKKQSSKKYKHLLLRERTLSV
ncbi:related to Vacuolar cation-transporting ATPase YPK9 [Saccharomycodes ludwigii]|uniref:Cation-transporting ATPase n=1 Tax=Saccharomycodes ludwigii TaxID=36035 RepID=A0A376B7D5_9ASCO|nr:hypothetical protein SCDLUD_005230 [Saccharomycodes ludwigii]KAH3898889.1 hypothetical protein SCDLUD_005230 [Saccharomycodes ludwigii]SSD60583.1 related to Vacuolar cation-transporting ATPase YPK9 [Saccharomycodes ludwigii]